ncbi:hypothetical protein GCM10010174_15280 [Kutzneria viridogrisea]|uniref:DUF4232 domain-containing protein n=2 Tax=Kutzneria TaxID=43356 RepID=W5WJC4_9PSEU|nr:DUF4232 domain-containing protein [Kutzneria albida]AHI00846.1 hypothetical protein KALB_7488 [Kutzneria albida DSM 43870]MBA8926124.1 hypothetical protein [Kutzneria viridogrisea]
MTRSIGASLAVGVLAVGVLTTACGARTTNTSADSAATSGSTSSPTTSGSSPASSASGGGDTKSSGPAKCTTADLKVTLGQGDAGAGHAFTPIVFTNTSGKDCTITGYPGVSFVTGDNGSQVGDPATRVQSGGATVTLAPGKQTSADLSRTNVGLYDPAQCAPTEVRGLRVYPPDNTAAVFVPLDGQACSKTVPNQTPLTIKAVGQ